MTTIAQTQVEEKRLLQPATATGWRRGLTNILRKELGQWWSTKTWLVQVLIWVLLLNGVAAVVMVSEAASGEMTITQQMEEVVATFLQMEMFAVAIGLVVTVQGAIIGEKQLGTAAWVMSKPASRSAFIVAKAVAYIVGFGVTAVIIPSIIFILEARLLAPLPLSLPHFLVGLGVVALDLLFYLMLTLMLGAISNSRGLVTGIGVALLIGGLLLKNLFPLEIQAITPWLLPDVGAGLALQRPLPDIWFVPVVASAIWTVLFSIVALWRFGREEF